MHQPLRAHPSFHTIPERVQEQGTKLAEGERACSCVQGGVSKATKALHVSEDVFAGIAHMVRGAKVKMVEHSFVGKVRRV